MMGRSLKAFAPMVGVVIAVGCGSGGTGPAEGTDELTSAEIEGAADAGHAGGGISEPTSDGGGAHSNGDGENFFSEFGQNGDYRPMTLTEILAASEHIVVGRVVAVRQGMTIEFEGSARTRYSSVAELNRSIR